MEERRLSDINLEGVDDDHLNSVKDCGTPSSREKVLVDETEGKKVVGDAPDGPGPLWGRSSW